MIATLLLFGFLAGLDNLQVCSSLGLLAMSRARRWWLAVAFSLCETVAPGAGLMAGRAALIAGHDVARLAGPIMMVSCALVLFASELRGDREDHDTRSRLIFGLPLSLSLDNAVAGLGISSINCPLWLAAMSIGFVSAAMSCIGLYGAGQIRLRFRRLLPARTELAVGGYLCVLALREFVKAKI